MNFSQAIASGFQNYLTFAGRASRSEYWYWILFTVLGSVVTAIVDYALFDTSTILPLNSIFNLVCLLPILGLFWRRMHDIDRTGWWFLITFTIIGNILLLIFLCMQGTAGPNRFGPATLATPQSVTPRAAV
jgi:uncharacterized membrane protein YhaH (DUF805 family)